MVRTRALPTITLALACLALIGCGGGDAAAPPVPEKAINDDVAGLAWVDVDRLAPDKVEAAANALIDAIPTDSDTLSGMTEQMRAGLAEWIGTYRDTHDNMIEAGVEGMMMGMLAQPAPENAPEQFLLVKVSPDADPQAVFDAIRNLDADAPAPQFELVEYADGWLAAEPGENGPPDMAAAPTDGSADNANAFQNLLKAGTNTIPLAFSINEEARNQLRTNPPQQLGPIAPALADAESGSINLTLGATPALNLDLSFANAKAAQEFADMLNGMLTMGKNQVKTQLSQLPESPDPARVDALFDKLKITTGEAGAAMSVDVGVVEQALAIANDAGMLEQMAGMLQMMMMGGPSGMPAPGPGPGAPMPAPDNGDGTGPGGMNGNDPEMPDMN